MTGSATDVFFIPFLPYTIAWYFECVTPTKYIFNMRESFPFYMFSLIVSWFLLYTYNQVQLETLPFVDVVRFTLRHFIRLETDPTKARAAHSIRFQQLSWFCKGRLGDENMSLFLSLFVGEEGGKHCYVLPLCISHHLVVIVMPFELWYSLLRLWKLPMLCNQFLIT